MKYTGVTICITQLLYKINNQISLHTSHLCVLYVFGRHLALLTHN